MKFIRSLTIADYLTLIGLSFSWTSLLAIFNHQPKTAILLMLIAFIFDLADGYTARKLNTTSEQGRLLDSFVDVSIYVVFSALFFGSFLTPHIIASAIIGLLIINFGILRLLRFVIDGYKYDNHVPYYEGVTTVHLALITILLYLLSQHYFWNGWYSSTILGITSVLQLSSYRSYKPKSPLALFALAVTLGILTLIA